jgi:hypothetical protein
MIGKAFARRVKCLRKEDRALIREANSFFLSRGYLSKELETRLRDLKILVEKRERARQAQSLRDRMKAEEQKKQSEGAFIGLRKKGTHLSET